MTVRDDLAAIINGSITEWFGTAPTGVEPVDLALADAVLDYLGQLDPDADPELIAWLRRENAWKIARLRAALADALEGMEDMRPYVSDYFAEKWEHDDYITRARDALGIMEER